MNGRATLGQPEHLEDEGADGSQEHGDLRRQQRQVAGHLHLGAARALHPPSHALKERDHGRSALRGGVDHVEHQERRDPDQYGKREQRNHREQLTSAEILHPQPILGRLAQERDLYGPQVQTRRHRDPKHYDHRNRVDVQGTEEDLELRREVGQGGQPKGGEGGQDEEPAEQRHDPQ